MRTPGCFGAGSSFGWFRYGEADLEDFDMDQFVDAMFGDGGEMNTESTPSNFD